MAAGLVPKTLLQASLCSGGAPGWACCWWQWHWSHRAPAAALPWELGISSRLILRPFH